MDDVPTAQPALALAQKVIARVSQAGLPADLIPAALTSVTVSADVDAENALRTAVLEFMDTVRRAEKAIAAGRRGEDVPEELDVAALGVITEEEWRAYWPAEAETEPAPDRIPSRRRPSARTGAGGSARAGTRGSARADARRRSRAGARRCRRPKKPSPTMPTRATSRAEKFTTKTISLSPNVQSLREMRPNLALTRTFD